MPPRIARLTAFLTITSFSPAARLRDSAAFGLLILPSAIAAHARDAHSGDEPSGDEHTADSDGDLDDADASDA